MEDKLYKDIYQWLYLYKKNSVKLSTFDRLETSYKLLLRYSIASVRLDKLTEDMLQGYINELVSVTYNTYIHLFGDNLEAMRKTFA